MTTENPPKLLPGVPSKVPPGAASEVPPETPPERRSEAEERRMVSAITELFERRITFNEFLGFRIGSIEDPIVRIEFDMRPELIGHYLHGRLHGGVIASVLDVAGGLAVMRGIADRHPELSTMGVLQRFVHLGTIDLRVDFLRQGVGERFVAEAEVVRLGRRIASCSMRLSNESGTLISTGNATYIVS